MTLENKLEFDLPCWENISADCKDIINRLLDKDPKTRITLDKALSHKWFSNLNIGAYGIMGRNPEGRRELVNRTFKN